MHLVIKPFNYWKASFFRVKFILLQDQANFWQTDLLLLPANNLLNCSHLKGSGTKQISPHNRQGFHLKPETGRFVWLLAILCLDFDANIWGFFYDHNFFYLGSLLPFPPSCSPTNCPISFKILLYKDNLSELQPSLGNWFLGSRNSRNSISECSFFKDFLGKHVPRPPLVARIFGVQCFQIYVPSLKKMSKTMKRWRRQGGERFHFFSSLVHLSHSHMSHFTLMHHFYFHPYSVLHTTPSSMRPVCLDKMTIYSL